MSLRRAQQMALAIVLGAGLAACASTPSSKTVSPIRVLERNVEGMEHRALPDTLEGCEFLGRVRASQPSGCERGCGLLDILKAKAARKGGDTLVVLPGAPVMAGGLRGSVFRCGETSPP